MNAEKLEKTVLELTLENREIKEEMQKLRNLVVSRGRDITKDFFTVAEVAKIAGFSERKISLDLNKGRLKATFPRAKRKFSLKQVQNYLRGI